MTLKGEGLELVKDLLVNKNESLSKDIKEVKETVKKESKKTRKTIKSESVLTREELGEKLAAIPDKLLVEIKASQAQILADLLDKFESLELDHKHSQDLIKVIGKGIDKLFFKVQGNGELLTAFGEAAKVKQM